MKIIKAPASKDEDSVSSYESGSCSSTLDSAIKTQVRTSIPADEKPRSAISDSNDEIKEGKATINLDTKQNIVEFRKSPSMMVGKETTPPIGPDTDVARESSPAVPPVATSVAVKASVPLSDEVSGPPQPQELERKASVTIGAEDHAKQFVGPVYQSNNSQWQGYQHSLDQLRQQEAGLRHQGPDLRHPGPDLRHQGSDLRHPGLDLRHPGPDLRHQGSDLRHPGMDLRHQGPDLQHQGSDLRHQGSDLQSPPRVSSSTKPPFMEDYSHSLPYDPHSVHPHPSGDYIPGDMPPHYMYERSMSSNPQYSHWRPEHVSQGFPPQSYHSFVDLPPDAYGYGRQYSDQRWLLEQRYREHPGGSSQRPYSSPRYSANSQGMYQNPGQDDFLHISSPNQDKNIATSPSERHSRYSPRQTYQPQFMDPSNQMSYQPGMRSQSPGTQPSSEMYIRHPIHAWTERLYTKTIPEHSSVDDVNAQIARLNMVDESRIDARPGRTFSAPNTPSTQSIRTQQGLVGYQSMNLDVANFTPIKPASDSNRSSVNSSPRSSPFQTVPEPQDQVSNNLPVNTHKMNRIHSHPPVAAEKRVEAPRTRSGKLIYDHHHHHHHHHH